MQALNAKYTLWQLIQRLIKTTEKVNAASSSENTNVLVVRNVNPDLHIMEDFDFNGDFYGQAPTNGLTQGSIEDFDLETIDFTKENIKVIFAGEVLAHDIQSLFKTNIVYRIQGMEDGVIETRTTRSKYGESVTHYLIDLNEQ